MIVICEITRRLRFPAGVKLGEGLSVLLLAEMDDQQNMHLYFEVLRQGEKHAKVETDSVLNKYEITDPAGNKQQWEKVRQLVRDDVYSPNEAWMYVALKNAIRKWKFVVEENAEDSVYWSGSFSIQIPGRFPIEARIEIDQINIANLRD